MHKITLNSTIGSEFLRNKFQKRKKMELNISESMKNDKHLKQFQHIYNLDCSYCEYITGSSFSPYLKELNCYQCPNITDIGKLSQLEVLNCGLNGDLINILKLDKTKIEDKSIDKLTNLQVLRCENRNISDATISKLKNLVTLDFSFCKTITRISISSLPKLTHLIGTYIEDALLLLLPNLIELRCIRIKGTTLSTLKKLKILDVRLISGKIDNAFKSLTNLEELYANGLKNLTDTTIGHISKTLRKLDCTNCYDVTDKSIILCSNLYDLDCCNSSEISDKSISKLKLKRLFCGRCTRITNDSILKQPDLKILICWHTSISNMSIGSLLKLTSFTFGTINKIIDKTLSKLLNLVNVLVCGGSQLISDISISKLIKLISLGCRNCPNITDKSINKLKNLQKIEYRGCPKISIKSLKTLPYLKSVVPDFLTDEIKQKYYQPLEY